MEMETFPIIEAAVGVPAIIALVAVARKVGLPKRFAGVAALVIAGVMGTVVLIDQGYSLHMSVLYSLSWGASIVGIHNTIIKPVTEG